MIADGARDMLQAVSTFWMKVPSPKVASGSGQDWTGSTTIMSVQSWIAPIGLVIFLVTFGLVLIKIAYDTRRAGEGLNAIIRSLVTTLAGGLPLLAVTMLLIEFGDQFSPWILQKAAGQDTSKGFAKILVSAMMGSATGVPNVSGALLLIYLFAILGGIMQVLFMILRGAALIVLLSFAQVTAAGTATEEGWMRFKRIGMIIVGFALYKPVAAVIYGVGLKLMSDGKTSSDQLINSIYGLTVIVMAALALVAVIKFVAPAAAMGASSAFSGGAALGAIATGAAVVALAGTGGGAAAAGAAGGAGGAASGGGDGMVPGSDGEAPGARETATASGDGGGSTGAEAPKNSEGTSSSGGGDQSSPGAETPPPSQGAPQTPSQSGGGSGMGGALQAGASTVQNVTGQINQAGDDASRES